MLRDVIELEALSDGRTARLFIDRVPKRLDVRVTLVVPELQRAVSFQLKGEGLHEFQKALELAQDQEQE